MKKDRPRVTKLQRAILEAVDDWKAPYEVAIAIGTNNLHTQFKILLDAGYVKHSVAQNTYRITQVGRDALANP